MLFTKFSKFSPKKTFGVHQVMSEDDNFHIHDSPCSTNSLTCCQDCASWLTPLPSKILCQMRPELLCQHPTHSVLVEKEKIQYTYSVAIVGIWVPAWMLIPSGSNHLVDCPVFANRAVFWTIRICLALEFWRHFIIDMLSYNRVLPLHELLVFMCFSQAKRYSLEVRERTPRVEIRVDTLGGPQTRPPAFSLLESISEMELAGIGWT